MKKAYIQHPCITRAEQKATQQMMADEDARFTEHLLSILCDNKNHEHYMKLIENCPEKECLVKSVLVR